MSEFIICQSRAEMAEDLASLQRLCFPNVSEQELITASQYRAHIERFPDGQLAVLRADGSLAAGSTSCLCHIDLAHYQHSYMEASGQNWLHNHDPRGDWLYGVDIGVHPRERGQGLSKLIYDARKALVRRLGIKGILVGGMLKGYSSYRATMPAQEYLAAVQRQEIFDPTVSVQLRRGFQVHGFLPHYIDDPTIDGAAALLMWRNDAVPI